MHFYTCDHTLSEHHALTGGMGVTDDLIVLITNALKFIIVLHGQWSGCSAHGSDILIP